jgi:hypothetical protein
MSRDVDMRLPADEPEPGYWWEPQDSCPICGAADPRWCDEAKHAAAEDEKA